MNIQRNRGHFILCKEGETSEKIGKAVSKKPTCYADIRFALI